MSDTVMTINGAEFTFRHVSASNRTREYVRITSSDGRAVSFYPDGDLRLYKDNCDVVLGAANPDSTYVHFVERT